jgi:hypothetical protein
MLNIGLESIDDIYSHTTFDDFLYILYYCPWSIN